MSGRRYAKGTTIPIPINTGAEYHQAVEALERLQRAPLGTDQTEGLQDLIEAVLNYEEAQGPGKRH